MKPELEEILKDRCKSFGLPFEEVKEDFELTLYNIQQKDEVEAAAIITLYFWHKIKEGRKPK